VLWEQADKAPGSRIQGWEEIRTRLSNALPGDGGVREKPGLFVFDTCLSFLETFPVLPRDDKKLDDVDTEAEDHIGDEVRYRVRKPKKGVRSGTM